MTKRKKTESKPVVAVEPEQPQPEPEVQEIAPVEQWKKPAERQQLFDRPFRKSDRLENYLAGNREVGASCNTFSVGDSVRSIAEAVSWGLFVSYHQGAPSWNLNQLRPAGSPIATGGTASGAASFAGILDSAVAEMKRNEKKNGAGIAYLNWNHPDVPEFLARDFKALYRGIYLPTNKTEQEEMLRSPVADLLVAAYDKSKCFLVKKPEPTQHGELMTNLCVEVELPHRGTCVLGVINLSYYTQENIINLPVDFANATQEMYNGMQENLKTLNSTDLYCYSPDNVQFGLGVSGLASMLANWSVKYEDFTRCMAVALLGTRTLSSAVTKAANNNYDKAGTLVYWIIKAYEEGAALMQGKVRAAFCIQPSATGAYLAQDSSGYHSSPEIQPVIGMKTPVSVRTLRSSELLGDLVVDFHPDTETIEDVPYSTYRGLCELWQKLLNLTGLAHRHSANFYGEEFTKDDLSRFLRSYQRSLYYRLAPYNVAAIDKADIGVEGELEEEDEGFCSLQQPGNECTACAG